MNNLTVGNIIELDIRTTGINGEGVGYYNKLAVFVPGAIQKESIYAKIIEVHDRYAIASIDSFIRQSKMRVEPFCKYYGECGACTMQHIAMPEQLKIKREILINSIKRYSGVDPSTLNIQRTVPSEDIAFRNKSQMPFRDTNFGLALGLYATNSNKFIFIDNCPIQNDLVNEINHEVLSSLLSHNEHTERDGGVLKYLVVRALESSREAQVTFVVSAYKSSLLSIAEELIQNYPEIKSVAYTIQEKGAIAIFGSETVILAGNNYIKDSMLGLNIRLSPASFYQLNKGASEALYQEIISSNITSNDVIFDGYSGIGVLGLLAAKKAKHVYSVDLSSDSIKNARIIARENDIKNITFFSDRIENRFPELIKEGITPSIIFLDPPRLGLDPKVIQSIIDSKAKRIFYISCNTSTLSKNLKELLQYYDVDYMRPYDFFTETALVETLCFLKIKAVKAHK